MGSVSKRIRIARKMRRLGQPWLRYLAGKERLAWWEEELLLDERPRHGKR